MIKICFSLLFIVVVLLVVFLPKNASANPLPPPTFPPPTFDIDVYDQQNISDPKNKMPPVEPSLTLFFVIVLLLTIILELLAALVFVSRVKVSKKILVYVFLVNIITLSIVWFLFPLLSLPFEVFIVISEIFAVLFESYFIYLFGKQIISYQQSLKLSLLNNFVSLFIGGFLLMYIFDRFFV